MRKSSLLEQASDEYKLEIYQISTRVKENIEFDIDYAKNLDLPFHVNRQTGHIYIDMLVLSSKYVFEFDITFEFNVIQRNYD